MRQTTVKCVVDALHWIDNNAHHVAALQFKNRTDYKTSDASHIYYANYHERMRVPRRLFDTWFALVEPNPRPFDSRMMRPNRKGRRMLRG